MRFSPDEVLTRDSMDQIQSNMTWIWENTPRGKHINENGTSRSTNILAICGKTDGWVDQLSGLPMHQSQWYRWVLAEKQISFGESFASECTPSVTLGLKDLGYWADLDVSVRNITSSGFVLSLVSARGFTDYEVCWQAVGYK